MPTTDINKIKIACSPLSNTIFIGRVNKAETEWLDKRDATNEAIAAVRDHLAAEAKRNKANQFGWEWDRNDGATVRLTLEIIPPMRRDDDAKERGTTDE